MGIKSLCLFFGLRFCLFPSPPIPLLLGRRSESEELKVDRRRAISLISLFLRTKGN
jgi:hypothetical protein